MKYHTIKYGKVELSVKLPNDVKAYTTNYPAQTKTPAELLFESIRMNYGPESLDDVIKKHKSGKVVIVVSDITRPIPYYSFLPQFIEHLTKRGINTNEIQILVATGMHRPSTHEERIEMFGQEITEIIQIIDHNAENDDELVEIKGKSWSGSAIRLNKHYVNAALRIVTGLVEPHFMAGFSGGRKAICPGLVSLDAIQQFHGYRFLSNQNASNTVLDGNPCHMENTSIAQLCPAEYSIQLVLDQSKKVNAVFCGDLFLSHEKAVEYVKKACCPTVTEKADVIITSGGGYPLDTTFYQCVKGMVACLPALKKGGEIIAAGRCSEGIGGKEYSAIMRQYSGKWEQFNEDIKNPTHFTKDQWQYQMQTRVLEKTGQQGLHFITSGLKQETLDVLSVNGHAFLYPDLQQHIQDMIDEKVANGKTIAIIPDGPYCAPV